MHIQSKHILPLLLFCCFSASLFCQDSAKNDTVPPVPPTDTKYSDTPSFEKLNKEEQQKILDFIESEGISKEEMLKFVYENLPVEKQERIQEVVEFMEESRVDVPVTSVHYFSDHVEFGEMTLGETKIQTLTFKNTGTEPYVITEIWASCPCLEVDYEKATILPGEEGTVKFTLTTAGYEPVPFKVNVSIHDNSTPNRRTLISGNGLIKKKVIDRERL